MIISDNAFIVRHPTRKKNIEG